MAKPKFRRSIRSQRKTQNRKKRGVRPQGLKLRSLQSLNEYEPTIKLLKASFDPEFIQRVRRDIEKPEIIEGMVSEVCGAMGMNNPLQFTHDPISVDNPNDHGFQRGGVETLSDGKNQYCQPKTYSARVLWHTHPKGVPAYPSGSDIFVTMIRDCSGNDNAQSYVEFLFTEHGFWVIHRKVTPENTLAPAIDLSKSGGKGIKMRDVENMITNLEDRSIRPEYFRDKVPKKESAEKISKHLLKLTYKNLVHISFHNWDEKEFDIPEALFNAPITNVCLKE